MSESEGASNNERLLAAARTDNQELLLEVFAQGGFDINCKDGLGNTPLHNAVAHGSTDVLEDILCCEECDVDPINRLEGATPLHLAVKIEHTDLRQYIVESLLDAGADIRIRDKNGETVLDIVPLSDVKTRQLIRRAEADRSIPQDDIASDGEGSPGFGFGSDED